MFPAEDKMLYAPSFGVELELRSFQKAPFSAEQRRKVMLLAAKTGLNATALTYHLIK
jgi:hypothetical protein